MLSELMSLQLFKFTKVYVFVVLAEMHGKNVKSKVEEKAKSHTKNTICIVVWPLQGLLHFPKAPWWAYLSLLIDYGYYGQINKTKCNVLSDSRKHTCIVSPVCTPTILSDSNKDSNTRMSPTKAITYVNVTGCLERNLPAAGSLEPSKYSI